MKNKHLACSLLLLSTTLASPALAEGGSTDLRCTMTFEMSGWSAFYKTSEGTGKVTCSNGESADVVIRLKGGGITFGKTEIRDGKGVFSKVYSIEEVFGGYAAAEAHAGAGASAKASVYTKGIVSLAMSGTGRGINLGVDFGKLTISRAGAK